MGRTNKPPQTPRPVRPRGQGYQPKGELGDPRKLKPPSNGTGVSPPVKIHSDPQHI